MFSVASLLLTSKITSEIGAASNSTVKDVVVPDSAVLPDVALNVIPAEATAPYAVQVISVSYTHLTLPTILRV